MKVVLVNNGDYTGIYVDGELKTYDDHFNETQVLNAIGIEYESMDIDEDDERYWDGLPNKLEDING